MDMPPIRLALAAGMAVLCAATPSQAENTWSVEVEASRTTGADPGTVVNVYPSFTFDIPLNQGWVLEFALNPEVYANYAADPGLELTDPYIGLVVTARPETGTAYGIDLSATYARAERDFTGGTAVIFAEGDWGRADLGQSASALGEICVLPLTGVLDDIALATACPSETQGGSLRYVGRLDAAFRPAISLARHGGNSSLSAALTRTRSIGDSTLTFGFGAELAHNDGEKRIVQSGLLWDGPDWSWGLAAAYTDTAGPDPWGLQGAVTRPVSDALDLTIAVGTGRLTDLDGGGRERSFGLTVDWQIRPDHLTLSGGVARRWLSGDRRPESRIELAVFVTK
jgi:hypothetical protein